jgi:hypothetical protein
MKLEEGEEKCSYCNGSGYDETDDNNFYILCLQCGGKGKVDWVTKAMPKVTHVRIVDESDLNKLNIKVSADYAKQIFEKFSSG